MSESKFKVGDKVRVIADPRFGFPSCDNGRSAVLSAGTVGTIRDDRDSDGDYKVASEEGDPYGFFVHENSLEHEAQAQLGARIDKIVHKVAVEKVVTEIEEQVEEVVTLTITKQQAESLHAITRRVGGDPYGKSRRGDIDRIREALVAVGIDTGYSASLNGSLLFDDEEGLK